MRILLYCKFFFPSVGGTEQITEVLAREFVGAGHEVRVLTRTPFEGTYDFPVPVFRRSGLAETFRHLAWGDVVFQNHVGPRLALPALLARKPLVVLLQTHLDPADRGDLRGRLLAVLFRGILRRARVLSISEFMRVANRVSGLVVRNPYDASTFRRLPAVARTRDLLYVGRMVTEKGVDVLLRAFARVAADPGRAGLRLTLVGVGPEEPGLRRLAAELRCEDRLDWRGALRGEALASCFNEHRVLVVPSRWQEPLGIVAAEGLACGCVVVGSRGGGLPEVIGPCGWTFPNGDDAALAGRLREALDDPARREDMRAAAGGHLASFQPGRVAAACLREIDVAVRAQRGG